MPGQDGSLNCLKTLPQLVHRFDLMELRDACALSSFGASVDLLKCSTMLSLFKKYADGGCCISGNQNLACVKLFTHT